MKRFALNAPANRKILVSVLVCVLAILLLWALPTGFERAGAAYRDGSDRIAARVLSTDNSRIVSTGLVQSGEQRCEVELLEGPHKGETAWASNHLNGSLEQDKIYEAGDKALVLASDAGGSLGSVSMIDHYRMDLELFLLLAFFGLLIAFAGWTGVRAILSFALSVLTIWKVLVPCCLRGMDPILIGGAVTAFLTLMILALVFGFDRRCLSALAGAVAGIALTCLLSMMCTDAFRIQGAVMSFSESLLYSGYANLDLTRIFMASVFIGSSGAMMDLTVDIAAAVSEVVSKRPDLSRWEAAKSGLRVGRAAMGTMTTTLLLAYSGGFIALLMVFMAQGTPLINILNYKYVASEVIHTLVGSFGLAAAAPLTALASGLFLARPRAAHENPVLEAAEKGAGLGQNDAPALEESAGR